MMFCTALNCMDGRVQQPVIEYLQKRFNAEFVDAITEPGIDKVLADKTNEPQIESIFNRIEISVSAHKSKGIAIVGHHDCAGNPVSKEEHLEHIKKAVSYIKEDYPDMKVIGLWVDDNWEVTEV